MAQAIECREQTVATELVHEGDGASLEGPSPHLRIVLDREYDDLDSRISLGDEATRLQAFHVREAQIEHDDVGLELVSCLEQRPSSRDEANDVMVGGQQPGDGLEDAGVVVSD